MDDHETIRPLDDVVREYTVRALAICRGNKREAARRLGIGERTLDLRLEKWGLREQYLRRRGGVPAREPEQAWLRRKLRRMALAKAQVAA